MRHCAFERNAAYFDDKPFFDIFSAINIFVTISNSPSLSHNEFEILPTVLFIKFLLGVFQLIRVSIDVNWPHEVTISQSPRETYIFVLVAAGGLVIDTHPKWKLCSCYYFMISQPLFLFFNIIGVFFSRNFESVH